MEGKVNDKKAHLFFFVGDGGDGILFIIENENNINQRMWIKYRKYKMNNATHI